MYYFTQVEYKKRSGHSKMQQAIVWDHIRGFSPSCWETLVYNTKGFFDAVPMTNVIPNPDDSVCSSTLKETIVAGSRAFLKDYVKKFQAKPAGQRELSPSQKTKPGECGQGGDEDADDDTVGDNKTVSTKVDFFLFPCLSAHINFICVLLFRRLCRGPKWQGDLNSTTGSGMRKHWLMQKKAAANLATKLTEITLQLEAERALRVEAVASLKLEKSKFFPVKTVSSRHHRSQDSAGAAAGNSAGVGVGSSSERDGAPPKKKYRRQLPSSSSSSSSVSQCRCGNRRVSTPKGIPKNC
jgi:hypothetical protein